jgi:hypothetical protein
MALRRLLARLPVAVLVVCAWTACKDKAAPAKKQATVDDLEQRCRLVGQACGDKEKHIEKLTAECQQAIKKQVEKGCTAKAVAMYDCYLKELCGGSEKVWALEDLGVRSDRHKKCVAERNASRECVAEKEAGKPR